MTAIIIQEEIYNVILDCPIIGLMFNGDDKELRFVVQNNAATKQFGTISYLFGTDKEKAKQIGFSAQKRVAQMFNIELQLSAVEAIYDSLLVD